MQYAREACASILGCDEKADWKNCKMDTIEALKNAAFPISLP